jgi:glyoxylase I family protein
MGLSGVAHVAITVTDLGRSKEWYGRVLGWAPVMEGEASGVTFSVGALPDGGPLLGLREYDGRHDGSFDPTRVGLDHLAFAADSVEELSDWEQRFTAQEVVFSPTQVTPYGHVLNFKDPDDIALEIWVPPDGGPADVGHG